MAQDYTINVLTRAVTECYNGTIDNFKVLYETNCGISTLYNFIYRSA